MYSTSRDPRLHRAVPLTILLFDLLTMSTQAAEIMPPSQQNALVQKYCAVCHTDAARNGGLSLQHFDVLTASPSLTAMMLSKVTQGVMLKTVGEAASDLTAATFVAQKVAGGAINAAGVPKPDRATLEALVSALATEAKGAMEWTIESSELLTASILREAPSKKNAGQAESYRVIASCNPATKEGSLQVAWSPIAQYGQLAVSVDGKPVRSYRVEGTEKWGNGSGTIQHSLAAVMLAESRAGQPASTLPLPAQSLTISGLFPDETVTFPFANLPEEARDALAVCFPPTKQ